MSNRALYGIYLLLFIIALGGIAPAAFFAVHFAIALLIVVLPTYAVVACCRGIYQVGHDVYQAVREPTAWDPPHWWQILFLPVIGIVCAFIVTH